MKRTSTATERVQRGRGNFLFQSNATEHAQQRKQKEASAALTKAKRSSRYPSAATEHAQTHERRIAAGHSASRRRELDTDIRLQKSEIVRGVMVISLII